MALQPLSVLEEQIGAEESIQVEFKSSRDLSHADVNKRQKFVREKISVAVSAMLNSEGGKIFIGIEEGNIKDKNASRSVASGMSDGVPKEYMTAERLENQICGFIRPSCAAYVKVDQIRVNPSVDEPPLYAFVINVRPGITAYQAEDKIYYARRNYANEPMEDKDIRLRMLGDEKPRAELNYKGKIFWDELKIKEKEVEKYEKEGARFLMVRDAERAKNEGRSLSTEEVFDKLTNGIFLPYSPVFKDAHLWLGVDLWVKNVGIVNINAVKIVASLIPVTNDGDDFPIDRINRSSDGYKERRDEYIIFDGSQAPKFFPEVELSVGDLWYARVTVEDLQRLDHLSIAMVLYVENGPAVRLTENISASEFRAQFSAMTEKMDAYKSRVNSMKARLLEGRPE